MGFSPAKCQLPKCQVPWNFTCDSQMANQNILVPILYSSTVVMGTKRTYDLSVISQTEIPELWTRFSIHFNAVMLRTNLTG